MIYLRKFFSELTWPNSNDRIFYHLETDELPIKYLKHLLLIKMGIESISDFEIDIARFKFNNNFHDLRKHCVELFRNKLTNKIILKVVLHNIGMDLPNFSLFSIDVFASVISEIKSKYNYEASEIWVCSNTASNKANAFCGRISLPLKNICTSEIIEIINNTSPRALNTLDLKKISNAFLIASRAPDKLAFSINEIFIPNSDSNMDAIKQSLINNYKFALSEILFKKENIDNLIWALINSEAREVILEFISDSRCFRFIDLDLV